VEKIDTNNPSDLLKSIYTYTSPIDFPELQSDEELETHPYHIGYPYLPTKNYDFKRGLLKNLKMYNHNKVVKEIENEYDYEDGAQDILTGVKLAYNPGMLYPYGYVFKNGYQTFKYGVENWDP